ncbi:hypothetical protein B0H34DRAFT_713004 [Crassisporium funariophilum]|nr:hypothetical protein B0H34DRAFT_713004 [Crassisporium funariophilum]
MGWVFLSFMGMVEVGCWDVVGGGFCVAAIRWVGIGAGFMRVTLSLHPFASVLSCGARTAMFRFIHLGLGFGYRSSQGPGEVLRSSRPFHVSTFLYAFLSYLRNLYHANIR